MRKNNSLVHTESRIVVSGRNTKSLSAERGVLCCGILILYAAVYYPGTVPARRYILRPMLYIIIVYNNIFSLLYYYYKNTLVLLYG